jgi:hypothetical protein
MHLHTRVHHAQQQPCTTAAQHMPSEALRVASALLHGASLPTLATASWTLPYTSPCETICIEFVLGAMAMDAANNDDNASTALDETNDPAGRRPPLPLSWYN